MEVIAICPIENYRFSEINILSNGDRFKSVPIFLKSAKNRDRFKPVPILLFENSQVVLFPIHLVAERSSAEGAGVIVFVPFRQNEEQPFPHRDGPAAPGAVYLRGVEFIIGLSCHSSPSLSGTSSMFSSQTVASLSLGAR